MQAKQTSDTLSQLLQCLNNGAWHDGNALGAALGVSRTAVWKAINRLQAYGIEIDKSAKGYRLAEPIILLDIKKIKAHIHKQALLEACHFDLFETVSSTSQYLAVEGTATAQAWHVCLAEHQSQGRGRIGRVWLSPFAKNIYCSCLFYWPHDLSRLGGISLLIALAINAAIRDIAPDIPCQVKWPNDVLVNGAKLAGTLLDVVAEANGGARLIIGMGININSQPSDQVLDRPWTSLQQLTGKLFDRNYVLAKVLMHLHDYLSRFEQLGWPAFIEEWQRYDGLVGQLTTATQFSQAVQGIVKGVNPQGHLLLETQGGDVLTISSGELT